MAVKERITAQRVREVMDYSPDTGILTWRKKTGDKVVVGAEAGYLNNNRRLIGVDGRMYYGHRLAWLWMTGKWPDHEVDHKDLDQSNNKWNNLRAATRAQNAANRGPNRDRKRGLKGVSWSKQKKKWTAQLKKHGAMVRLGFFNCPAAAHFAYIVGAQKAFGEFARFSR